MTLYKKRFTDEIFTTAPKHEIAGLIEVLAFVRQSRMILLQEAFSEETSIDKAEVRRAPRLRSRSPDQSRVSLHEHNFQQQQIK